MASAFYNWDKVFSFNAYINMIVTARGRGKTYGLRKQFVKDYLKDGSRFVEFVRYNKQVQDVCDGYFSKLEANGEFPELVFKAEGSKFFLARKPKEDDKPRWELCGYCVSLNDQQNAKKKTFANVKRVMFDEFILERHSLPGYLHDEWGKFANLIDTIARQIAGEETKVRVYLCANACDLVNPYFVEFGIMDEPREGFTWLEKGFALLHYEKNSAYSQAKRETLAGRLSRGHNESMITNTFDNAGKEFIARKAKDAKFVFGFVFKGDRFGVWLSLVEGLYFVNRQIPNGSEKVFALTREDASVSILNAKRANYYLNTIIEMFYANCVRYDSYETYDKFLKMSSLFGVR